MPISLSLYAWHKIHMLSIATQEKADKAEEVLECVSEACLNYELIADYFQRPLMNDLFRTKVCSLDDKNTREATIINNFLYMPRWLGAICTGVFVALCAPSVIAGSARLGPFLAMITVTDCLATDFGELYQECLMLKTSIDTLRGMTLLFNMETDVGDWLRMNKRRMEVTKLATEEIEEDWGKGGVGGVSDRPTLDRLPIQVRSVCYRYEGANGRVVLSKASASALQGSLIAISGSHGAGRTTLMRIIAHKFFPDDGMIFIPTHLRVLHVSHDPFILKLSAWRNLTFGHTSESPERVKKILSMLDMKYTLDVVQEELTKYPRLLIGEGTIGRTSETEDYTWQQRACATELFKLHFARALIMNPEVLVLQHPFRKFNQEASGLLMGVIKRNILERGLCLDGHPGGIGRRRPRTAFFTASNANQEAEASVIWRISEDDRSITMEMPRPKYELKSVPEVVAASAGKSGTQYPMAERQAMAKETKDPPPEILAAASPQSIMMVTGPVPDPTAWTLTC